MVERRSQFADSRDPRRLRTEWFLDALFPNGKTVAISGFAEGSEGNECPEGFRYIRSAPDNYCAFITQAAILSSTNENVQAPTLPAIPEPFALTSVATKSVRRLSEKWKASTSSPWFALMCAGCSFAVLLVLTGAFAGMALTKQPVRMDMTAGPRIGTITPRDKFQIIQWNYDNDPIAMLIERTSHPEPPAPLPPTPEEVERELRRLLFP
jgi:hypothetical protein